MRRCEKSGTHIELLSAWLQLAGFGMLLCIGPFWTVPGTQVRLSNTVSGTIDVVKSSLAVALNSTRMVRSFAVCMPLACLI